MNLSLVIMSDVDGEFLKACEDGDLNKIKKYIDEGGNIEVKDNCENTPLIVASANGYFNVVKLFIRMWSRCYI